jgi:peptidoglycan/LPS O-acetylase OafA/YrhL
VIDLYIADGSEPLWVTSIWLALKFLVVWLALRLTPLRAFLAVVAMVIASTVVLMAWEIVLPTSLPLLALLVLRVAVETAIEVAVLVWAFRVVWSRRFSWLLAANMIALALSVVTALSSDIDRASSAYIVPVGSTRADVVRAAGGPSLERSVGSQDFAC